MATGAEIEIIGEQQLEPTQILDRPWEPLAGSGGELRRAHLVDTHTWLRHAQDRAGATANRCRRFARRHQGAPNPRQDSQIRRYVWLPPDHFMDLLGRTLATGSGPTRLTPSSPSLRYDGAAQAFRTRALLRVPWSIGRYATWLAVEPWWGTRCVISISLRGSRRPHYSKRYFDAGHDALDELTALVGAPIGPRSLRPRPMPRPGRPGPG